MSKKYENLTEAEKMIVAMLYNLYKHYYSLISTKDVKASLIDDFKHHLKTYQYEDIENYINWDYFKAHENQMSSKSEKSNLFKLSQDVITSFEKYKRIDEELRKPSPSQKIINFFYPKK